MQVVNVWFQICVAQWANSIRIVTGPHSINAKSFLVLVRTNGVRVTVLALLEKTIWILKKSFLKSFETLFYDTKLTFILMGVVL